jgi:hypothetical protein
MVFDGLLLVGVEHWQQGVDMKRLFIFIMLVLFARTTSANPLLLLVGSEQSATATITYQSATTCTSATTTLSCNTPTSTADGDLLVAIINNDDNSAITATGWTQIQYANDYASADTAMYYKVASSEGSTVSFTRASGTSEFAGVVVRLTKSAGTWAVTDSGVASGASQTTLTVSGIGATNPGMLLFGWGSDDARDYSTAPADMTSADAVSGLTASRCQMFYQNVSVAQDYSKTMTWIGDDHAIILAAIGVTL